MELLALEAGGRTDRFGDRKVRPFSFVFLFSQEKWKVNHLMRVGRGGFREKKREERKGGSEKVLR